MERVMNKLLLVLLLSVSVAYAGDHTVPPKGVIVNTNIQQLCTPNFSASIRPPVAFTNKLKREWTPVGHKPQEYELDHYIPLALGGNPKDPNNLWLQVWDDAKKKDKLEAELHREVCSGKKSLSEAQSEVTKW